MQTPKFLSISQVIDIHERQIQKFGGSIGIRDEGLLDSALAQPQATFGGQLLHPTIREQAAAYLYHLVKNHPFIDGNKRMKKGVGCRVWGVGEEGNIPFSALPPTPYTLHPTPFPNPCQ